MTEFFKTGMGHTFFERTMPVLVRELGRLGGAIGTLEQAVTRLADARALASRRRVLFVHHDVEVARAVGLALSDRCELHLARSYSMAEGVLMLHDIDVLVTEPEAGWPPAGPPLFELARQADARAVCALVAACEPEELEALALRLGADAAIEAANVDRVIRGIERLLR